ncbi:MAG: ABC transporter permease [Candidatus Dojkabacteria bacterium]
MSIFEVIKVSFSSIVANKIRSFLTILGIIIGIAAVIALLSVGQGAQQLILDQVAGLGANTVNVIPISDFSSFNTRADFANFATKRLDSRLLNLLENDVKFKEVQSIGFEVSTSFSVTRGARQSFSSVSGVNADYFSIRGLVTDNGVVFTDRDDAKLRKYAVLGSDVYATLFGESEAVDESIRIDGTNYKVIGVLEPKSNQFNTQIYIPFNTAAGNLFGSDDPSAIIVQVEKETLVDSVAIKIETAFNEFYHVKDGEDAPFSIVTSEDVASLAGTVTSIFTTLLTAIAGISLVVGGIGIMNIMLVSVSERTKEIGLRKAVGAKQSAILSQFLAESVTLTLIGGVLGIIFGVLLGNIIGTIGDLPVILSPEAVILATSVSATIGVIFGFYPAYTAANLNPIDALRYE